MKQIKSLLTWILLLVATHVMAVTISVDAVQFRPGGTAEIVVNLTNTEETLSGYQMSLYLPDGITLQTDQDDDYIYTLSNRHGSDHTITITPDKQANDGSLLIVCFSVNKKVINGTSGELLRLPVNIASTVTTSVQGSLKNIQFADKTNNGYEAADATIDFQLIEEQSLISFADANVKALCVANWDANGDGELSEVEAAAVTSLGTVFKRNKTIISFDELQYFTGLTSIESAFSYCSGLTSIIIPNSVTSIGSSAFRGCSLLTSIEIPNSVTSIGGNAFDGCRGLTSVTIPNSVTSIGMDAFNGCISLTSVIIPNSMTNLGGSAFSDCSSLTSITIPNSVTSIGGYAFEGCSGLMTMTVEDGNPMYDSRDNCNAIIATTSNTLIAGCKNTIIPNSVVYIGSNAFKDCQDLTSVTIPNNVISIEGGAFFYCRGLISVTIGNCVTSIGDIAFGGCSGLTSVTVLNPTPVTISQSVFSNRANATLYVPYGCTEAYQSANYWKEFKEIVEIDNRVEQTLELSGIPVINVSDTPYCLPETTTEGLALTWAVADATIASISGNMITPKKSGATTVTASQAGNDNYLPFEKTYTLIVNDIITNSDEAMFDFGVNGLTMFPGITAVSTNDSNAGDFTEAKSTVVNGVILSVNPTMAGAANRMWFNAASNKVELRMYGGTLVVTAPTGKAIRRIVFDVTGPSKSPNVPMASIGTLSEDGTFWIGNASVVAFDFGKLFYNAITVTYNDADVNTEQGGTIVAPQEEGIVFNFDDNYAELFPSLDGVSSAGFALGNDFYPGSTDGDFPVGETVSTAIEGATVSILTTDDQNTPNRIWSAPPRLRLYGGTLTINASAGLEMTSVVFHLASTKSASVWNEGNTFSSGTGTLAEDGKSIVWTGEGVSQLRLNIAGNTQISKIVISSGDITHTDNVNNVYISDGIENGVVLVDKETAMEGDQVTVTATPAEGYELDKITVTAADGSNVQVTDGSFIMPAQYVTVSATFTSVAVETTDVSQLNNVIYIEDTEARMGTETTLSIKMKNTAAIRGFQFDLYLPDGITVVKSSKGRIQGELSSGRLPDEDEHNLTFSEQPDGAIRFLCSSQYDETFTGNDGEIATLRVNIADDMEDGEYSIQLKNMKLTETNISNYYETALVQSKITIFSYIMGDISGDGVVDVSDYTGVANHIHGSTPEGFNAKAADVDESGTIDVSDYTGIANIIHTGSIYGASNNAPTANHSPRKVNTDLSTYDNVMYVSPFTASAGSVTTLSIKMKNTAEIRGFQFDLYLPDGMTVAKSSLGRIQGSLSAGRLPAEDEHELTFSEQPDGAIRFLCSSQYDETFTGNDGEIATLQVNIANDMAEDDYPIQLKNIKLTETDISKFYTAELIESTVTIEPNDGRIHFDETATTLPTYTAGEKGNVTMKRSIKAGQWSTIVLPFTLTKDKAEAIFGTDVKLAEFSGFDTEYSDDEDVSPDAITIHFTPYTMTARKSMTGGKLFLIKISKENFTEFEADDVTLFNTVTEVSKEDEWGTAGKFTGTFVKTVVPADGLFISDNEFWYSVGKTNIKAFRGWFELDAVLDKNTDFGARVSFFVGDDVITSIDGIPVPQTYQNGNVYTITGKYVGKDIELDRLPKGIYIVNGKKCVVK